MQCSGVRCGAVRCGAVRHGKARRGMAWHGLSYGIRHLAYGIWRMAHGTVCVESWNASSSNAAGMDVDDGGMGGGDKQQPQELLGPFENPPKELPALVNRFWEWKAGTVKELSNKRVKALAHAEDSYTRGERHTMLDEDTSSRVFIAARCLAAIMTEEGMREREATMKKAYEGKFEQAKQTAMRLASAIATREHAPSKEQGHPPAKFRCGQTVLQYWAGWFKTEPENTQRIRASGKDRPVWYIGEILAGPDYQSIVYAGVRVEDHCYYVH